MSETQTLTLTDFLLARITEDEVWLDPPTAKRMVGRRIIEEPITRVPRYIARDRERWLAECEAKRAVVEAVEAHREGEWDGDPIHEQVLRPLASIYSDHPDFNPEWS